MLSFGNNYCASFICHCLCLHVPIIQEVGHVVTVGRIQQFMMELTYGMLVPLISSQRPVCCDNSYVLVHTYFTHNGKCDHRNSEKNT